MPRSGGPATTTGVSYQALAVATRAVDVFLGRIASVRPEVPPSASFGTAGLVQGTVDDYVVVQDGKRTFYQAKSNAPGGGNWTLTKLCDESILQDFFAQAREDSNAQCRLLTPNPCELLGPVCDLARGSKSYEEFAANLNQEQKTEFEKLCRHPDLKTPEAEVYELLKRFGIEQQSLESLQENLSRLSAATFVDASGAMESLFFLAAGWMRLGTEVTPALLTEEFGRRSVYGKPQSSVEDAAAAIRAASARLAELQIGIRDKVHILQPAVLSMLTWARDVAADKKSLAAFLDNAGSGKSVAMSVLYRRLQAAGYDVLGIRLDGLAFTTPAELQSALGLPGSVPAVVQLLKGSGRKVAVLIDQLDALALNYTNRPGAVSTILDLAARVAQLGGIPVVVACRSFDWNYSHVLSELKDKSGKQESLPELTDEQLKSALSAFKIRPEDLHADTLKVVRSPYRLNLLIDIIEEHRKTEAGWVPPADQTSSLQALLEEFWALKLRKAEAEGGLGNACSDLAKVIAQHLSERETLTAPLSILDPHQAAATWLTSNGILQRTVAGVSFFHQTFFDFIFARAFYLTHRSTVEYFLSTDQGLFYRSLVRQLLAHARGADRKRYLKDTSELLTNAGVREHLRWLVIAHIGQADKPTADELAMLRKPFLEPNNFLRTVGFWNKNPGWFDLIGVEQFDEWLDSEKPEFVRGCLVYLESIIGLRQAAVIALLAKRLGKNRDWNGWISTALMALGPDFQEPAIELLQKLLADAQTDLDEPHGWWWMAFHGFAKHFPKRACEMLADILGKYAERWPSEPPKTTLTWPVKLLPNAHEFTESLKTLANKAPASFLEAVLPWATARLDATSVQKSPALYRMEDFLWRIMGHMNKDSPGDLLKAIRAAASNLAKTDAAALNKFATIVNGTDLGVLHSVLTGAYAANPIVHSDAAAEYLLADSRRLRLGDSRDHLAQTIELLSSCAATWSSEVTQRIEAAILRLLPVIKPTTVDDLRRSGTTSLRLLSSLEEAKLSERGRRVLGELRRKHPGLKPGVRRRPDGFESGVVGPPIPRERLEVLSESGWVGALKAYATEKKQEFFSLRGGRLELENVLEDLTQKNPDRFYRLAMEKMDLTFYPGYCRAILTGLGKAKYPADRVFDLIEKFKSILDPKEIHRVTSPFGEYPPDTIPDPLSAFIRDVALHSPFPENPQERTISSSGAKARHTDLLTEGINNNRGSAVWTISKIYLQAQPLRIEEFLTMAEEITKDPAPSVRAVCIEFLQYAIHAQPARVHAIFEKLVDGHHELLSEIETQQCMYRCLYRNAEDVLWAIEKLIVSEDEDDRESGARLACLAAFQTPKAHALRDRCLAGDSALRRGAATVYAANLTDKQVGEESQARLLVLMEDADESVRTKATGLFARLSAAKLAKLEDFLIRWSDTKSLKEGADDIAISLNKHPIASAKLTLAITGKILAAQGAELMNIQARTGMIPHHLIPALLNVYRSSADIVIRKAALDLFEKFEALGSSEVRKAFESFDRS